MRYVRRTLLTTLGLFVSAALAQPEARRTDAPQPQSGAFGRSVAQRVFDAAHGLGSGWRDFGWAPRVLAKSKPAQLDFADRAGWILARPGLSGTFGSLLIRYKAPPEFGDFLEVQLETARAGSFPRVELSAEYRRPLAGGWTEALVPLSAINPRKVAFEQIVVRARKDVGHAPVFIECIALMTGAGEPVAPGSIRVASAPGSVEAATVPSGRPARFVLDCSRGRQPINPMIYGIAGDDFSMGASAFRWGGNPSTRYNWQVGHVWNAGADWFFRNVDYTNDPRFSYDRVLENNRKLGLPTALTVPMIGWVAKDTDGYSFPVSVFGPQEHVAPENPDVGNGKTKDGRPIAPGPQTRTSVPAPPEFIAKWISTIREKDKQRGRSVQMVILDNEPMLWNTTHRDVHPSPLSYDELLARSIAYATAVRKADPEVKIAGPAEWGWTNYYYSALDVAEGVNKAPDRRAHGNVPLLPWWLSKMRAYERKSGLKLLDILDVHFYPAGSGIGVDEGGATDRATNALRLRSTRGLWDVSYIDESWIGEPVELIPRLRRWVNENAPGLGIQIGEYSFGADGHQSGGLAQAEALGRFGTEGLTAAFYWRQPRKSTPVFWAFRAYRNFDGAGGRFLDLSVPVEMHGERASLFASRSESADQVVAVLLNMDPDEPVSAEVDLTRCGSKFSERAFQYLGGPDGISPAGPSRAQAAIVRRSLPPYSITVLDWKATPP